MGTNSLVVRSETVQWAGAESELKGAGEWRFAVSAQMSLWTRIWDDSERRFTVSPGRGKQIHTEHSKDPFKEDSFFKEAKSTDPIWPTPQWQCNRHQTAWSALWALLQNAQVSKSTSLLPSDFISAPHLCFPFPFPGLQHLCAETPIGTTSRIPAVSSCLPGLPCSQHRWWGAGLQQRWAWQKNRATPSKKHIGPVWTSGQSLP